MKNSLILDDRKQILVILLSLILLSIMVLTSETQNWYNHQGTFFSPEQEPSTSKAIRLAQKTFHELIQIENDLDLQAKANEEGWVGDGTASNPFLIENYHFTSQNASIEIANTSFYVQIRNCIIEGTNNGLSIGINLTDASHIQIFNNTILNYKTGVEITSSGMITIAENNIHSVAGIKVDFSSTLAIQNNRVMSTQSKGIQISYSNNNSISRNQIAASSSEGLYLDFSYNNTLTSNTISFVGSHGISIFYSADNTFYNNTVEFSQNHGISLVSSGRDRNTFLNNTIRYSANNGININGIGYENIFINNSISYSQNNGINIDKHSRMNLFSGNRIIHSQNNGIYLFKGPKNNSFVKNYVISNQGNGISVYSSPNNTFKNNFVNSNSLNGIKIEESNFCTLTSNIITLNRFNGMQIIYSDFIVINKNNLSTNTVFGVYLDSSDYNIVKWNNFISNNNGKLAQAYSTESNSEFYQNYYGTWTSPDSNSDGIVDEPYSISGSDEHKDSAPLVTPVSSMGYQMSISLDFLFVRISVFVIILLALIVLTKQIKS